MGYNFGTGVYRLFCGFGTVCDDGFVVVVALTV